MKYKILSELGRGGMGAVYKAQQTDLDRVVALKVLLKGGKNEERSRARFLREIEICMRLSHPNIIRVFDHGESEDNQFFTMELIEGRSLHEVIAEDGKQAPGRVIDLLIQMLDALDHCHKEGVIHRDVKPRNIMISGQWHATLMDLGLIHIDNRTVLTDAGTLVGTPRYVAPEAILRCEYLPASDVYSMGVVAYEVASAQRPVEETESIKDLLRQIVQGQPKRIREHVPDFPQDLEDLIHRMLEKDPEKRPGPGELLTELRAMKVTRRRTRGTRPMPVRARVTTTLAAAPPPAPSRRRAGIAGFAAMLALAAAVWFLNRPDEIRQVAGDFGHSTSPSPVPAPAVSPSPATVGYRKESLTELKEKVATVRRQFQIESGELAQLVPDSMSLRNAPALVPGLVEVAQDMNDLMIAADEAGLKGPPWIDVREAMIAGFDVIRRFFSLHGNSSLLVGGVRRLGAHVRLDVPDPFRHCLSLTIESRIPITLNPSLWAQEKVAKSNEGCFDDLGRSEPSWRNSPEGVWTRLSWIDEATYLFRHSEPTSPENFPDKDRLALKKRGMLPDILQVLPRWPDEDSTRRKSVRSMLEALALLISRVHGPGELPELVQDAEKLAALAHSASWPAEDRDPFEKEVRGILERTRPAKVAAPQLEKLLEH